MSPPYSWLKSKSGKKPAKAEGRLSAKRYFSRNNSVQTQKIDVSTIVA
jgi:hypothetical protein